MLDRDEFYFTKEDIETNPPSPNFKKPKFYRIFDSNNIYTSLVLLIEGTEFVIGSELTTQAEIQINNNNFNSNLYSVESQKLKDM